MAQDHLHHLDRDTAWEQERASSVARIVLPDHEEAALLNGELWLSVRCYDINAGEFCFTVRISLASIRN